MKGAKAAMYTSDKLRQREFKDLLFITVMVLSALIFAIICDLGERVHTLRLQHKWFAAGGIYLGLIFVGVGFLFFSTRKLGELRRVTEALTMSEERFRRTFERAGTGMALLDKMGRPVESNPALQKMLGYSQEELGAIPLTKFTHPEDTDKDMAL
jgi:PAS domain-containing protein